MSAMFDKALSLALRLAAVAVILGWVLSFFDALTFSGYLLAGIPAVVVALFLPAATARRFVFPQPNGSFVHGNSVASCP